MINHGVSCNLYSSHTYIGAFSEREYSKTDSINLASLFHLANFILKIANTNKYIINSLEDFFIFIQRNCQRAERVWGKNFPSSLLNLREIRLLAPSTESQEIISLPLSRLIKSSPEGLAKAKIN